MRIRILLLLLLAVPNAMAESRTVSTLEQALEQVRESNPILKSTKYRVQASEALIEQASLLPNPELEVEAENFGGDLDGFQQSETTIGVSQRIELGGKRSARTAVAEYEKQIAFLEAEILALSILNETTLAFVRVQVAEARRSIFAEQKTISRSVVDTIRKKLKAGAVLPVEQTKAEIALKNDEIAFQNIETELQIAKQSLAVLWAGSAGDVGKVNPSLNVDNVDSYLSPFDISESPLAQLAENRRQLAEKKFQLEKSLAVPDVNVGFGYRRFEETEENAFLGMVSVELPLFNRNQGAVKSGRHKLFAERLGEQNMNISLATTLTMFQAELRRAVSEHRSIEQYVLPSAKKAFAQAKNAYQLGRTSYLDLFDAQRTLIGTKIKRLDLLLAIAEAKSQINNLVGVSQLKD